MHVLVLVWEMMRVCALVTILSFSFRWPLMGPLKVVLGSQTIAVTSPDVEEITVGTKRLQQNARNLVSVPSLFDFQVRALVPSPA